MTEYQKQVNENLREMFPNIIDGNAAEYAEITPMKLYQAVYRITGKGIKKMTLVERHAAEELAAGSMGLNEKQLQRLRQGKKVRKRIKRK